MMNTLPHGSQPLVAAAPMTDVDGVNLLLEMTDDAVRRKVGEAFLAQMQNHPRVQGTFFPRPAGLLASVPPNPTGINDWIGEVASALIALALAQCSSHGFNATVDNSRAQGFLTGNLTPTNSHFLALASSNYNTLFPSYCAANGITIGAFLGGAYGDRAHWGTVLASHMASPAYINQEMAKLNPAVDAGAWYQIFYANLWKVAALNGSELAHLQAIWRQYLHGKEVPAEPSTPWTVYDYMLPSSYNYNTFMGQVQTAIASSQSHTETLGCQGGPAAHCTSETTTTYGAGVNNWLGGNAGLGGFVHGATNQNTETHDAGGGGASISCCFVPGTPILLGDGSTKPVEHVLPGDQVVGRNGDIRARSPQDVRWRIEPHELLFGINDYPPFFTASHPFMTTEGWKSMSPRASRMMNPDLQVTQLREGDVVLQAAEGLPLRYREITIVTITRMLAKDAGPTVHSLHLAQDNPGYHANGFLVAVNYPQLREDLFLRAFAGITEAERTYLRSHFEPLVPFLRRGLGNYVSEILRRALAPEEDQPLGAPEHTVVHR